MKFLQLANGVLMPSVALGTWQIPNGEVCYNAVKVALEVGYRHIDTAMAYQNEESVGKAIKDFGIKREDVFITTKLPAQIKGYQEALDTFHKSLNNLGIEYIDLYLIHAPKPWDDPGDGMNYMDQNIATWKAFEKLYEEGKVRAIGVSNFKVPHLEVLMKETKIVPHVNQIKVHPEHFDLETIEFCKQHNIIIQAYSPFATGRLFGNEILNDLAQKYNKTLAQIAIRWSLQHGFNPLPKSITPERIKENFDVFDFELTKEDMDKIDSLWKNK